MDHFDSNTTTLAPADATELERQGLVTPAFQGMRHFNKRRQNRSSDDDSVYPIMSSGSDFSASTISSPGSSNTFSPGSSVASPVDAAKLSANPDAIPHKVYSVETFCWLGFRPDVAERMMQRWQSLNREDRDMQDIPISFDDLAIGFATSPVGDVSTENDDWRGFMDQCGMATEFQEAIMLPEFEDLRLTASCKFWVTDTINMRWRALMKIVDMSQARAQRIASGQAIRSISATLRDIPGMSVQTATMASLHAPGSIVLWKGLDQERVRNAFDANGNVVHWADIATDRGADFHGRAEAYYWAVERETALRYAKYARNRSSSSTAVILRIQIPNYMIESLDRVVLTYPSPLWQELIWLCRRRQGRLPKNSAMKAIETAHLLIGHICRTHTKTVVSMSSFNELTYANVLKLANGEPAIQYCFRGEMGTEFMETCCGNFVTMHALAAGEYGDAA